MKYQQPYDESDPDAPYTDGNASLGIEGSIIRAAAIEHHQRELVSLITKSGLTPSASDLLQVPKAVRSQHLNWVGTFAGSANALSVTLDPAPADWADLVGVPLRGIVSAQNTSTSVTFAVTGLSGTKPVKASDGGNLRIADLRAGAIVTVIYNGTNVTVITGITFAEFGWGMAAFTSVGTTNFTVPANIHKLWARAWGGGGGGGGSGAGSAGAPCAAGGGASGEYREGIFDVTPGQVIPMTVGAGGTYGPAGGATQGTNGTSTSVGSLMTALSGSFGGSITSGLGTGGVPGSGSGGTMVVPGSPGQGGTALSPDYGAGGLGGGSFGTSSTLFTSGTIGISGNGYDGQFPGGGGGGGVAGGRGGPGSKGAIFITYWS